IQIQQFRVVSLRQNSVADSVANPLHDSSELDSFLDHERCSAAVSRAWTKILSRAASAARRALLYSFRATVKPTNTHPRCSSFFANKRDRRRKGVRNRLRVSLDSSACQVVDIKFLSDLPDARGTSSSRCHER